MSYSRLTERRQKKRLQMALLGITAIAMFLGGFGLKILVGFSLLVDKLRGTSPTNTTNSQVILQAPSLEPMPEATNSASFALSGHAQSGFKLIIYLNDRELEPVLVSGNGEFRIENIDFIDGQNTLSAKITDDQGNFSPLSNVVMVNYRNIPPMLEVYTPDNNSQILGENSTIKVSGKTETDARVTINGRLAVVDSGGDFEYQLRLNEGDNLLTIIATDPAGNQTSQERLVKYQK